MNARAVHQSVFQKRIKDTIFRTLWRERQNILPQAERHLVNEDLGGFSSWLEEFYRNNQSYFERQVLADFMAYAELIQFEVAQREQGTIGMTPEFELAVRQYVSSFATRYSQCNQKEMNEAAKQGVEAVRQLLDEWNQVKPQEVAEQEGEAAGVVFKNVAVEIMRSGKALNT